MNNKLMKSGIASLLIATTIFISDIDAVEAEEPEAEAPAEETVTNNDVQPESIEEESAETPEVQNTEARTSEPSVEPSTEETTQEDVLVGTKPDDSQENKIRQRTIIAHEESNESLESAPYAEPSSEQPTVSSDETTENDNTVPEPTAEMTDEPVTEEVSTAEPETEAVPASEPETEAPASEETNQLPSNEVPAADGPIMEPSAEVPSSVSEADDDHIHSESPEVPANENKRYFRYDHGNILEGISLEPGGSEVDLELLDKRVNRLLSARIMEESKVDDAVVYEIEEQIKSEEEVDTATSREVLPNTGEMNYTFIYGTVLLICGIILLFIMRKPKTDK